MANSIPPLLCNTPPPMEGGCFEDDDEDDCSMADSLNDDDVAATVSPQTMPPPHADLPVPDDDDVNDKTVRHLPAPSQPHHNAHTAASATCSFSSSDVTNEPNQLTATASFCASQSPPPLDTAPNATISRTTPPPPPLSAYRSESPPSLDFHDPPSLMEDVEDDDGEDDDYADRLSVADCLDDLPPDGVRPETPTTESSMPSLQLSPAATITEAPVAIAIGTLADSEPPPLQPSCSLHEMLQRVDVDDAALSVTTRSVTPTLDLNDSFEEFVEFDAAIAHKQGDIDCNSNTLRHGEEKENEGEHEQLETTITAFSEPSSNAFGDSNDFGADFSQFAVFQTTSPSALGAGEIITTPAENNDDDDVDDDDDFGDFADVTTSAETPTVASSALASVTTRSAMDDDYDANDADDDDDFGDFSDFQQTPVEPPLALTIDVQHICARIGPLLAMMFPPDADTQADGNTADTDEPITVHDERTGDLTRTVLNVDEPLALRHRWMTSMGKADLVQALGIDTAKIWNQSMPRFAANLGFTPLEPMKPSEAGILRPTPVHNNNTAPSAMRSASSAAAVADVPAAQFDWTGAGLVNPLDGVQAILHEAGHPQNRPSRSDAHWSHRPPAGPSAAASAADVPLGNNAAAVAAVVEPAASQPAAFLPTDVGSGNSISSSVSRVLPGIAGGLKETHIFTPSKARTMSGGGIAGADDVIVIDETVVTKEYRDVEYNPQPPVSLSTSYEAPAAVALAQVVGGCGGGGGVCLQPTKSGIVIDWPEPGRVSGTQLGAFEDFDAVLHAAAAATVTSAEQELPNNPVESFDEFLSGTMESPSRSVAGNNDAIQLNPIDTAFDDFSDYQYVPLPVPAPVAPVVAATLPNVGVGILQPQTIGVVSAITPASSTTGANGLMSWSDDSGINPDEMARLEALYPTPKTIAAQPTVVSPAKTASPARSTGTTADDVEWSDFVSSDAGYQPITHIINQNILMHQAQQQQQQSSQQHADEDDWTDFMSGGSVSSGGLPTISPLKSCALPHFAAWNLPSAQFNASHSWQPTAPTATTFLPNLPPMPSTPRLSPKHQNGGNGGSGSAGASSANGTPHFVGAVKSQPSISLIPDLGIVFGRTGAAAAASSSSSSTAAFRK